MENKTYIALKKKVNDNGRMPSIKSIHQLLKSLKINHYYSETQNIVEYRNSRNRYVNDRHEGKKGYELRFRAIEKDGNDTWFDLNTSDSYYSWNSYKYAFDLIKVLENFKDFKFQTK